MEDFNYDPDLLEDLASRAGLDHKARDALLKKAKEIRSKSDD